MHILCATDLSGRSNIALRRAGWLARNAGAELTVLHVVGRSAAAEHGTRGLARLHAAVLSQVELELGPQAAFTDTVLRKGGVLECIAGVAAERDADLIVVAAPRARRLESIVGTPAERLIRAAARPVLVARADTRGGYGQVAIAADGTAATGPMLRSAVRLAALDEAFATVVHAMHVPYDGLLRSSEIEESTLLHYQRGFEDDARAQLRRLADDAGLRPDTTRVLVRREPAVQVIRDVLEEDRPALLALGASRWFLIKRLLMGSVADQVLRTARCDVLVIPHHRGTTGVKAASRSDGNTRPAADGPAHHTPGSSMSARAVAPTNVGERPSQR
jgi:nucleotide-binding universal stress UspA family protein